jgi:NAD(P)H-nitrite reductase large subunit
MTHYVIIGGGIAGISAAETLRAVDRYAQISLVSDDPHPFYSRPGLAYYLTDEIPEKQLYIYNKQDWKDLNVRHVKGQAVSIDTKNHLVEIRNTTPLGYDRLLLATGARAVPLNVHGENLKGVVKLDDFEDARQILKLSQHVKTAVVVGGGIIALELVEGLQTRGIQVHYFMRGDRYWSNLLDEAESRIIENSLVREGVVLHFKMEVAEIQGRGGKVSSVQAKNGYKLLCSLVATGVGVKPRLELAQASGLAVDRGILVNEYLQSSDADIFAAGDVAQVYHPTTGRYVIDNLWTPGREQGRAAAWNMTGQKEPYKRAIAVNVVRLAGMMMTIIGSVGTGQDEDLVSVARGSSETWLQLPNTIAMASGNNINQIRLMVGERVLVGALVLGEQKLSLPLQELVSKQVDISPIRSLLLQPGAPLGQILMDYWSNLKS